MQHSYVRGQHTNPMLRLCNHGLEKKLTAPFCVIKALSTVMLLVLAFTVVLLLTFLLQLLVAFPYIFSLKIDLTEPLVNQLVLASYRVLLPNLHQ